MATSTLGSGTLVLAGTTSGTTTVTATAVAGTTTLTLPAATDTLVGKATTDTLTNKTLTGAVMNGTLGATTPSTVAATTLTTSSTVTHNGGTANGVAFLNASKVLTTGSTLVFDGSVLSAPNLQGPTFSAYRGTSSQSISNATYTKVQINTEEFDTASCFDPTTNFRFTPTTAGYYQVSGSVNYDPAAAGKFFCIIYKNGTEYKGGTSVPFVATQFLTAAVSAVVYLNGSTDYIELYTYQSSGGALTLYDSQSFTYFQAVMVRS